MENTAEWKKYAALNEKQRASAVDLVSKALVQAYVQIDKDLLLLEESGLMVKHALHCFTVCSPRVCTYVINSSGNFTFSFSPTL